MPDTPVVLEPAAQAFAEATANPPYLFDLPVAEGRAAVEDVQSSPTPRPDADVRDLDVDTGHGTIPVRILRPVGSAGPLPVVVYVHGAGWVFGSRATHDRLARELAVGVGAAVVLPDYDRAPDVRFPVPLEQSYAVARWAVEHAAEHDLDPTRVAIAGDSVGGNMSAAITLLAKERGDLPLVAQLLFYPVTDAAFDTPSYHRFAEGYFLRRDGMQWFWDQYTTDPEERAQAIASPLRASEEQLRDLPPALVITGEADVLRDEGEAYAARLRQAGVAVTATRYGGIIHDFVMLDALRGTAAAEAAITQAIGFLADRLGTRRG
ncbi:Esterase/lipase [Patulibacter medicamentivorans]|uniref:Esterase/lipase n=1 Tax=Patulibacter medicamentivorans TaxID=1097667 RepID=H0E532_9ACTN|nr:alpha/beta hydrolase [Patulibacter medicamentivorans]EHN11199.1 Esterase/lipase [Patulibacter medicamentivorans]